jgi:gas vesicle protein
MSKRDDLITDLMLKIGTDPNITEQTRKEIALQLHRDKMQRDLNRHEQQLERIKRSVPKQKVASQPKEPEAVKTEAKPLGEQVDEALKAFENSVMQPEATPHGN